MEGFHIFLSQLGWFRWSGQISQMIGTGENEPEPVSNPVRLALDCRKAVLGFGLGKLCTSGLCWCCCHPKNLQFLQYWAVLECRFQNLDVPYVRSRRWCCSFAFSSCLGKAAEGISCLFFSKASLGQGLDSELPSPVSIAWALVHGERFQQNGWILTGDDTILYYYIFNARPYYLQMIINTIVAH